MIKELKALTRKQTNYVYVLFAREPGKTQFIHDLYFKIKGAKNMIEVYYRYFPKHGGEMTENSCSFHSWQKALRFIKKVDGPNFNGYVTGWSCDDPEDNEILYRRHRLKGHR